CIARQPPLPLEQPEKHSEEDAGDEGSEVGAQPKDEPERHAHECAVRQRVAKICHPPPDDEAAERAGHRRDQQAGEDGTPDEIVEDWHRQIEWGAVRGTTSPSGPCRWSCRWE